MTWTHLDQLPETGNPVQALCRVLPRGEDPKPSFTYDVTYVEGDLFVSMGFIEEIRGEAEWRVAGWDWGLGFWAEIEGIEVVGWCPLAEIPTRQPNS